MMRTPRCLRRGMSWNDRHYYLRASWKDFCWHWRDVMCERLVVPLSRWACGSHWPVFRVLCHLDDLEDSTMYGGLCYEFPEHILVEDRITVAHMTLGWVRDYIKHNYFGEEK